MGMFDTVHVDCPSCKRHTELQSKSGPCELNEYDIDNAPISVLAEYLDGAASECLHCGVLITVEALNKLYFRVKEIKDEIS